MRTHVAEALGLSRWQKIAYGLVFVCGNYCKDKAVGIEVIGQYINNLNIREKVYHRSGVESFPLFYVMSCVDKDAESMD